MAYYEDKQELRDGRILLYKIVGSIKGTWQMRLNVRGHKGYITRTTQERSLAEAARVADDEFNRLSQRVREKADINDWGFAEHWEEWHARMSRSGNWKDERKIWHRGHFNRYFKPYFDQKKLNDMTLEFFDEYWDWRIAYWQTGPGAAIRRDFPQKRNSSLIPADKSLKMEKSALRQIFNDAHARRRMTFLPTINAPRKRGRDPRRAGFDSEEWNALAVNLRNYANAVGRFDGKRVNSNHLLRRKQLRLYVLFLVNTGLRVGEARQMRWDDIKEFLDTDGETKLKVHVRKTTKTGARDVISQSYAVKYMREWKSLTPCKDNQDFVWIGQASDRNGKRKPATDFNKSFQTLLRNIPYKKRKDGLLNDRDGDRRSIYSLRHLYATQRLTRGNVSIYDLSINMGTNVKQIEMHYSHVLTSQRSAQITQIAPKKKAVKVSKLQNDLIEAIDDGDDNLAKILLKSILEEKKKTK